MTVANFTTFCTESIPTQKINSNSLKKKVAKLLKYSKNGVYFLPEIQLPAKVKTNDNPIKLDVFRCVPCYLHLMTPSTCYE